MTIFRNIFLVTIVGFLWSNFSDGFLVGYPSWNLTYPIKKAFFEDDFSARKGGIC